MIRAYCDERYEGALYVLGGAFGLDQKFRIASAKWKDRCMRSGLFGFHPGDCERGAGEFVRLSREQRKTLSADMTKIFLESQVTAACTAIDVGAFEKVKASSEDAARTLGESARILCLQTLVTSVCNALRWHKSDVQIAFVFQQQEDAGAWAREFFERFKATHHRYAKQLGQFAYARIPDFIPLEMAAAVGHETMKEMQKLFDPKKPRSKPEPRMLPRPDNLTLLTERKMLDMVEEEAGERKVDKFAARPLDLPATHLRRRPV